MNQPASQGSQPLPNQALRHDELIDLNHPDLEVLRESLRATFPKEILSKGALSGIIEWRRTKGTFNSIEELAEIRGIGPTIQQQLQFIVAIITAPTTSLDDLKVPSLDKFERPTQLQIILGPHGHPYSEGAEIELGSEVVKLIKGIVARLDECDPITLWIENGFPGHFANPLNLDEINEALRRAVLEKGQSFTECLTQLTQTGTLPPSIDSFLRWEHDHARQLDQGLTQEEIFESLSHTRFDLPLFWWIEEQYNNALHSPKSAREITLKIEVATFDSWLNVAAQSLALEQSERAYLEGDLQVALESVQQCGRFMGASSQIRDTVLGSDILSYQSGVSSKETIIVIRGSYHGPLLTEALLNHGIESDQLKYGEPIPKNGLDLFAGEPEVAGAIELYRTLIQTDLEMLAEELLLVHLSSDLMPTISEIVSALTEAQLASWASSVGEIPASEELVKAKNTFRWLLTQNISGIEKLRELLGH